MTKPPMAVAFVKAHSWIGRRIAHHEFSADQPQYSHAAIALGNGLAWDSTFPWARIRDEAAWDEADWWVYEGPKSVREMRSAAYAMNGRVLYDFTALAKFGFGWWFGRPRSRGHGLWCSYGVAELLLVGADLDVSRCHQPWNVGMRDLWLYILSTPGWRPLVIDTVTTDTITTLPVSNITWTGGTP